MATQRYSCSSCSKWIEFDAADDEFGPTIDCVHCGAAGAERLPPVEGSVTGRYKYNKKLGRMVKVSDAIPRMCCGGGEGGGGGCGGSCGGCKGCGAS